MTPHPPQPDQRPPPGRPSFRWVVSRAAHTALAQDRPTFGSLPGGRHGRWRWGVPLIDLVCASVALAAVALAAGSSLFPAIPVAPLLLVAAYFAVGLYGRQSAGGEEGLAWPVVRVLLGAPFAWLASLLTPLSDLEQLGVWAGFVVLDSAVRALVGPLLRRREPAERWVLVGDEKFARRLAAFESLREFATVVARVPPPGDHRDYAERGAALAVVERHRPDRVVIAAEDADDEGLLDLVRGFRSIGTTVSLLPRPLDLLEAPAATPGRIAGVPLIEVEALAPREPLPYIGPERRRERRTKVSVVMPAKNEGANIAQVLGRLPAGLHEVILVDDRSEDDTVAVARRACPGIRVLTQGGEGKGDALRTGFAAVTGNLIVMLDADGSTNPAEIPRFVQALEEGADLAKGSRYLPGGGSADLTHLRSFGNAILSGSANLLHGTHFTDLCYGYNAFWARCLPFISLDVPGFEVETLINLRIADAGMRIREVPSFEEGRISGHSNLRTFRDGFRVLLTIVREARRRRTLRAGQRRIQRDPSRLEPTARAA